MKKNDEYFLLKAIDLAMEAGNLGNEPSGAILVKRFSVRHGGKKTDKYNYRSYPPMLK